MSIRSDLTDASDQSNLSIFSDTGPRQTNTLSEKRIRDKGDSVTTLSSTMKNNNKETEGPILSKPDNNNVSEDMIDAFPSKDLIVKKSERVIPIPDTYSLSPGRFRGKMLIGIKT